MKILLSDTMGYCSGVSRAIKLAEDAIDEAAKEHLPVYSLGKLIHNRQVCEQFAEKGMQEISDVQDHEPGLVVLRAHGIPDQTRQEFDEAGFRIVDATCPVVKRNLQLIARYSSTHSVIVVGHAGHPETAAMQGVMVGSAICPTRLITSVLEVGQPQAGKRYAIFVQTTFDQGLWNAIRSQLTEWRNAGNEVVFVSEVCPSSLNRREAALRLAKQCDGVIVIGGKDSANTKALYTLIQQQGTKVWHIENEMEITDEMCSCAILGITAGASTPAMLIQRVQQRLQQE